MLNPNTSYKYVDCHQFAGTTDEDRLLVFAAPAKAIARWAGIPKKGWHIRMLYQRWMTDRRELELKEFWNRASQPDRSLGQGHILGPTAITVAIAGPAETENDHIRLVYEPRVDIASSDPVNTLAVLAGVVLPKITARLTESQQAVVTQFQSGPLTELPDVSHDYVLEFALQLTQAIRDPRWFVDENSIETSELTELLQALEALCRPALVVDGQHRLTGAALADAEIWLPVIAMPNCRWVEQVYQFIVINEKAQKVESSVLTDIFGSSLTQAEQVTLRDKLSRARVDVEARIAAVIANRDPNSPFKNMVLVKLQGNPPLGINPYVTDTTVRLLIDGKSRSSSGWRVDDEFYEYYVKPTYPDRTEWESWSSGKWRDYWFVFWRTVGDFYNEQASLENRSAKPLWSQIEQTNLTKAVSLRLFQRLFMERAVKRVRDAQDSLELISGELGEDAAASLVQRKIQTLVLPSSSEAFAQSIRRWFLESGVPVRFFTKPWVKSLDDQAGQQNLFREMEKAYDLCSRGQRYRASSPDVFSVADE